MSKDQPTPDTRLRLAPELTLRLRGDRLVVSVEDRRFTLEPHMLGVLDSFRTPTTLRDAMQGLATRTRLDWIRLSGNLVSLYRGGILVSDVTPTAQVHGFASPGVHVRMLNDQVRTRQFLAAIRSLVRPSDLVLDLGTGTGVLAIAAAQAGARHVYAIERTGIADVAQRMFIANGVADRITLVRGDSTRIELPERADLMISEIVGNDPFEEQILTYTRDALARLLKQDARLIPSALRVSLRPVAAAARFRRQRLFDRTLAEEWRKAYGIDFTPLSAAYPEQPFGINIPRSKASQLQPLGPAVELIRVDLTRPPPVIDARTELSIDTGSRLDGILVQFDLSLSAQHGFGNDPWAEEGPSSWSLPLWLLPPHKTIGGGETISVRYRHTDLGPSLELL